MQCVTAVDPHWLAELGPMFFSVKETDYSRTVRRVLSGGQHCDAICSLGWKHEIAVEVACLQVKRKELKVEAKSLERELNAALEDQKRKEAEKVKLLTQPKYACGPTSRAIVHSSGTHYVVSLCWSYVCRSRIATPGAPSAIPRGRREPGTPMRRPMGL